MRFFTPIKKRRISSRRKPLTIREHQQRLAAKPAILEMVRHWSEIMGVSPQRVAIRNQRTRWGSASSLGNLNFNWRIITLPAKTQNYIIIHELAHLRELNHSGAFWKIVAEHCPDYQTHRTWLRRHVRSGRHLR